MKIQHPNSKFHMLRHVSTHENYRNYERNNIYERDNISDTELARLKYRVERDCGTSWSKRDDDQSLRPTRHERTAKQEDLQNLTRDIKIDPPFNVSLSSTSQSSSKASATSVQKSTSKSSSSSSSSSSAMEQ